MPDQDDFEPLARQWKPLCNAYVNSDASAHSIADDAIRVATAMLRCCGGCPILPDLADALEQYSEAIRTGNLWKKPSSVPDTQLSQKLDALARVVSNERISTIAIRSAKITAIQIHEGSGTSDRRNDLETHLASQIIKDLIGHCFLDTARAYAVGKRFSTNAASQPFYDTIMQRIDSAIPALGARLAQDPTGKSLRHLRAIPKQTIVPMIYNQEYRLDA